jgi:MFS family permease
MTIPKQAAGSSPASVESRQSWGVAWVTIALLSISYGAPLIVIVGLKPITHALDSDRETVALAASLVWIGTGFGGIPMGWLADRVGMRRMVAFGAVMIAAGLVLSALGGVWTLIFAHLVLVGMLGSGALYPPLVVYVSRWFDRRRGAALALVSSGQYIAGVLWPSLFERGIAAIGWRPTMLGFAAVTLLIVPLAWRLRPPPAPAAFDGGPAGDGYAVRPLGLPPNLVQGLLCGAAFLCCVPMAMPSSHLVAFCSDVGLAPETGALMLSVLLGCAFLSRMVWGWVADRIGGLLTVLLASSCQAIAITGFAMTQNEYGLFTVSAVYGLGFSGIIPAYVLAIREFFPSTEASWRVPAQLFTGMSGMAFGSWLAGALYDHFGYYAPAFGIGALFNLANLTVVGFLLLAKSRAGRVTVASPA